MANAQLDRIWMSLKATMDDTDELYRSVQAEVKQTPKGVTPTSKHSPRFGQPSTRVEHLMPPYTESQVPYAFDFPHQEASHGTAGKAVRFGNKAETTDDLAFKKAVGKENEDYVTNVTKNDFLKSLDTDLNGWNEAQRKVFYKLVSSAEAQMHSESERLRREYSLQLERKLAAIRREMADVHRGVASEFSELKVDHDRLSFDDSENRRTLKLTKESLEKLQKAYDNLMDECGRKSSEIVRLNSVVVNTERSLINLKQRVLQLENELIEKEGHIVNLHEDVATVYRQMEATSSNNAKAERKLTCTTNDLKNAQEELVQLKLDLESHEINAQLHQKERDMLEKRNKAMQQEIEELTAEKMRLEAVILRLEEDTIVSLKQQCKNAEEQLKQARLEAVSCDKRQELAQLKREFEAVQYQCNMFEEDNKSLLKENSKLTQQLNDMKTKLKDTENDLFQVRCKMNVMRQKGYKSLKPNIAQGPYPADYQGETKQKEEEVHPEKPKRRDIFAPTMFNAPSPEDQERIDELERQLTDLHLQKDRMLSEMTRLHVGPKSPSMDRRRCHLLEQDIERINKKIHEVSESIRKLEVPI